ncbi:MAG: hypothetical protein ACI3X1_00135 [Eubacteriales bacterium]
MSFSLLSIGLIIFFIAITAIEIYRYINRGLNKSLLAFGSSIISIILSIVISPAISGTIVTAVFSAIAENNPTYISMTKQLPSIGTVLIIACTALLNTLLFVIMFFVFRRLCRMVINLACRTIIKKNSSDPGYAKEKESWYRKYEKVISGVIGGLSSFMICMLAISPLMGTVETAVKIANIAEASSPGILSKYAIGDERISDLIKNSDSITKDVVGNTFYQFGGKQLYHASACADVNNDRVYISNELDAAKLIMDDFSSLSQSIQNNGTLGKEDVDALYALGDHIQDVEIVHYFAADVLSTCSNAWLEGKIFMGLSKPHVHPVVDGAIDRVLTACTQTDEKSINMNLNTLISLYAIILESDITDVDVSNYSELVAFVDESRIIEKVNAVLAANPYMSGINVSSIAMSAIADSISIETIGIENYNALMTNIASAIKTVNSRGYGSNEEKVAVMTTYAQKYISEYNIDVPDSVAEAVAQELLNELNSSESGEVTAQDISELISRYNTRN